MFCAKQRIDVGENAKTVTFYVRHSSGSDPGHYSFGYKGLTGILRGRVDPTVQNNG